MLTAHPGIKGIWAVWDVPAEGVISAARTAGRDDLVITTIDLGENVAIDMAQGRLRQGPGAQRPYDQGVTEAMLAGYGLLGKQAPPYVALPAAAGDQGQPAGGLADRLPRAADRQDQEEHELTRPAVGGGLPGPPRARLTWGRRPRCHEPESHRDGAEPAAPPTRSG